MDKKSTTFGLNGEKLVRLLKIGSGANQPEEEVDQEQKRAELLRDWLTAALPLDEVLIESLPAILRRLCQEVQPLAGKPFGSMLQDPKADIAAIKKIKDYSKKLVTSAKSEAEHDAATTIYYAAIANALVFHNQRITKFSYRSLADSFSALTQSSWLTSELTQLLKKAYEVCEKKAKPKGQESAG